MENQERPVDEVEIEQEAIQRYIQKMQGQVQNIQDRIIQNSQVMQEVMQVGHDQDLDQYLDYIQDITNVQMSIQDDIEIILNEILISQYQQEIILYYQDIIHDVSNAFQTVKEAFRNVQTAVQNIRNGNQAIQDANQNAENGENHREFGEDWFRWEDWKINEGLMENFYNFLNRMMENEAEFEVMPPSIHNLNLFTQMLYRKKRDASYRHLNIDKMVRFLSIVGVKYWYAVNACHYDPYEAIHILKLNAKFMTNSEYIEFLKRNPAREK